MHIPKLLDGRLKLRHLVLVDVLSTQGTVIGAARELHVTQPVVTRSLQDLEQVLGVALYERGPRGLTPTDFGVAFTAHARAVLSQLSQAARHIAEIAEAERGTVVVGTHLTGSNLLIPRAIAALKAERPLVTVVVREGGTDMLLAELESGRLDVIVGRLTSPSDERLVRRTLYQESVRVVVGAQHPLARRPDVRLEDLAGYPWILPGVETVLRRELETYFLENGFELPQNRVETTSFLTVRQLLVETHNIAVMPELIAREDPRISTLPISLKRIGHSVGLTLQADRRLNPATTALIDILRRTARDLSLSPADLPSADLPPAALPPAGLPPAGPAPAL
ncbi:DNA-binding transcriptional LysR family regulator [Nonomuraea muscovyensis]|uniref:DNA-binding transcriptional LysR family regulator n=1 Tax=Nonomuraea muscovyensis TaxID=1124761 RepID=A0A7X0EWF2_9ACTN|nr:LysR substrate-binding domain-containing protein [Nonomuraea muscovyensis]MBB6343566.1 DNA-binding transcriptional LysR family regulator [Nonomuraea muscovyensis]